MDNLKDRIETEIKKAMKAKDMAVLGVLRYLRSQIKNKEIEVRPESLKPEQVLQVIRKLINQAEDSLKQFQSANRTELVQKVKDELSIFKKFLPPAMDREELVKLVKTAISELKATSLKDMGKVMKKVLEKTKGSADSKEVSNVVKDNLGV